MIPLGACRKCTANHTLNNFINMKDRWQTTENLSERWDKRTILISKLIDEESNIIEFGAGRLVLKDHLPRGCKYTPSDITDRGYNTIVCDLNNSILPSFDNGHTVACFSGVLEYIEDVPRLIQHLSNIPTIITSYATLELNIRNSSSQWVNSYTNEEILQIFRSEGYKLSKCESWRKQTIYKFTK